MKVLKSPLTWALLCALAVVPASFETTTAFTASDSLSARTAGRPFNFGDQPRLCEAMLNESKIVRIDLTIFSKRFTDFQDVFQTAPGNLGFRLEIDKAGHMGLVFRPSQLGTDITGLSWNGNLTPNRKTRIQIEVSQGSQISLAVDNEIPVTYLGKFLVDCNDVKIGVGFDETRKFLGSIHGSIQRGSYTEVTYFGLPNLIRQMAQLVFLSSLAALVTTIAYERGRRSVEP